MSKTERDLSTDGGADAFDALFSDETYDAAFDDAIENADLELDIADLKTIDVEDDADVETDDTDVAAELDETDTSDETAELDTDSGVESDVDEDDAADLDDDLGEAAVDDADIDVDAEADEDDLDDGDGDLDADAETDLEVADDDLDADAEDVDVTDDEDTEGVLEVDDADVDDTDDDEYVLPEIVAATPDADALTTVGDPDLDPDTDDDSEFDIDEVSDDILEELRRADIDGPVVPHAPQDDTTAAVRRPRRAADYDPAPVPIPAKVPRVLGRKPRVRKVTRVVRHVDPWSVFKIAIIAHLVLYVIVLTASVLLWNVANATGTVDNVERFFESFGWNSFEFNGGELYHAGWIAGLFVVIGMTGLAVLAATLFNLITDLVGGVRFTVLEEEVVETRTSPMRRFVVRRPEPEVPALLHDASGPMYREAVVDDTGAHQRPTR